MLDKSKMYSTFVDEAGNTGFNIWDNEQPFFVIVGVTVSEDKQIEITKCITNEWNSYKLPSEKELKTKNWIKSNLHRRNSLARMLQCIIDLSSHIHVVVMEKRYMIAAKIVDDLLDPAYNDTVDNAVLWIPKWKVAYANYFYQAIKNKLSTIGECMQTPTLPHLKKAVNLILKNNIAPEVRCMIKGVIPHIAELAEDSEDMHDNKGLNINIMRSPNYTTFAALGFKIVDSLNTEGIKTKISFDDARMCNKEFKGLYDTLSGIKENPFILKRIGINSWKNVITDFTTAKSDVTPCIQAADIIATSINHYLMGLNAKESFNDYDSHTAELLRRLNTLSTIWYTMSDFYNLQLIKSLNGEL